MQGFFPFQSFEWLFNGEKAHSIFSTCIMEVLLYPVSETAYFEYPNIRKSVSQNLPFC